jgi:hypothetical protein
MKRAYFLLAGLPLAAIIVSGFAYDAPHTDKDADKNPPPTKSLYFQSDESSTHGSVTVGGSRTDYEAFAGTLIVHPKGWDDVPPQKTDDAQADKTAKDAKDDNNPTAEASMFYVAYFKRGSKPSERPVTF